MTTAVHQRYHIPVRRVYIILKRAFQGQKVDKHTLLKMAVRACNDTAGPNGLIPTLCVFGCYPLISWLDPPHPDARLRAETIRKVMEEIKTERAKRLVSDARGMRNGPSDIHLLDVPVGGLVRVWREKGGVKKNGGWTGPFKLVKKEGAKVTVKIDGRDCSFRSTSVRAWFE